MLGKSHCLHHPECLGPPSHSPNGSIFATVSTDVSQATYQVQWGKREVVRRTERHQKCEPAPEFAAWKGRVTCVNNPNRGNTEQRSISESKRGVHGRACSGQHAMFSQSTLIACWTITNHMDETQGREAGGPAAQLVAEERARRGDRKGAGQSSAWVAARSNKGLFMKEGSGFRETMRGDKSPGWQQ